MADSFTVRRDREIRDIYKKLRAKYTVPPIIEFMQTNYFIGQSRIFQVLSRVDKEPVQNPSLIYRTAMDENFKL